MRHLASKENGIQFGGAASTIPRRFSPAARSEFAVIKADNARGNFVKVAQRISGRVEIDEHQPLADRLVRTTSVVVSIDTTSAPEGQELTARWGMIPPGQWPEAYLSA